MAILFISNASDDTIDHYDAVIKHLEAAGQGHPPGASSTSPHGTGTATSAAHLPRAQHRQGSVTVGRARDAPPGRSYHAVFVAARLSRSGAWPQ